MPVFPRDNTSYKGPGQIVGRIEGDFIESFDYRELRCVEADWVISKN